MKVEFSATIEVPDGTPMEDVESWLKFELGAVAQLSGQNALAHMDLHSANTDGVYVRERSW